MERLIQTETLVDELESRLKEACVPYMNMPVALSGGIDSSLLAALIKPDFAISVELPQGKHNEIGNALIVAKYLNLKHKIVQLDESKFDDSVGKAVKAIGRPIPHFNIFPLYEMYSRLQEIGVKDLVLGDGPDETMMGYGRDLIFSYIYRVYNFYAFKDYKPMIDKILPSPEFAFSRMTGRSVEEIKELVKDMSIQDIPSSVDKFLMRKDMDDMNNGIAKSFGITNHRPYQDNEEFDNWMFNLPMEAKIQDVEYGKYTLRKVAEKYLPYGIAWKKMKVGGPVFPVNSFKGWLETDGEFGKASWLKFQEGFLK
jgi:asparagine synthetase B (glutamine-hydrolysing)